MITLKINNTEISVPRGSTILEAAEKANVFVPTLCHDKRITPYGACRLCVVEDRNKPGSLIPSCFTPARDRMDLVTDSKNVLRSVRMQLRLILVNHPLDCPVCDKAGDCTLQDLVIRYNITEKPFEMDRFTRYMDRESPLIERDMNRCVLCGRCVRICGELQGCGELEFINRGHKTVVGTDGGRTLDCDFCGLCISTCPVGAINDKLFKNGPRVWNLERRPAACSQCGLGCRIEYHVEKGKIRRVVPSAVPGEKGLICVRGRFGWRAFESASRLIAPQVRRDGVLQGTSWDEAISTAARELDRIRREWGESSLAVLTSDHLTTEEARMCGSFFGDTMGCSKKGSLQAAGYREVMSIISSELGEAWEPAGLKDLDDAEIIMVIGGGAVETHPALKPIINGLMKKEGRELVVLSSWPDELMKRATVPLLIKSGRKEEFFGVLRDALSIERKEIDADASRFGIDTLSLARLISIVESGRNMTVVVVPDPFGGNLQKARLALLLHSRATAVLPLGAQVNSAGALCRAGLASDDQAIDVEQLLQSIESGSTRALYLVGEDPLEFLPDPERVGAALGKLELIVCQSPYETAVTGLAHIVLPSRIIPEKSGSIMSIFGRESAINPIIPPPGQCRPDLEIFQELAAQCPTPGPLAMSAIENGRGGSGYAAPAAINADGYEFRLTAVPSVLGDALPIRQSPDISELRRGLQAIMNGGDFERLGLSEREKVEVRTPFGSARAEAGSDTAIPRGMILLRHLSHASGLSLIRSGVDGMPAAVERINR
jgi:predicted molibdopterin-dependent oxidoreductase YjgC